MQKEQDLRILFPYIVRFDALVPLNAAWGPSDVACQKLWLLKYVFDTSLGCSGHLTSLEKKWAPVAVKIFYKYGWGTKIRHLQ